MKRFFVGALAALVALGPAGLSWAGNVASDCCCPPPPSCGCEPVAAPVVAPPVVTDPCGGCAATSSETQKTAPTKTKAPEPTPATAPEPTPAPGPEQVEPAAPATTP